MCNVAQIEGLPAHYGSPTPEALALIESAEKFFDATGAAIRHGGNMAYYAPCWTSSSYPCPMQSGGGPDPAIARLHGVYTPQHGHPEFPPTCPSSLLSRPRLVTDGSAWVGMFW